MCKRLNFLGNQAARGYLDHGPFEILEHYSCHGVFVKLAFDAKRAFCNSTGLGSYGRNLIENLSRFYPENEYQLYTPKIKQEEFAGLCRQRGLNIIQPTSNQDKWLHPIWRSFTIKSALQEYTPDLYHGLSHEIPFGIEKLPIKTIVTIHDLIYLRHPEFFPWLDRKVYDRKFKYACHHADLILAISQQTADDIVEFFQVKEEKIRVLFQSCHPRFYDTCSQQQRDRVKREYQLAQPYILYLGTLEERKNALGLVQAFKQMKEKCNHQLVLIGKGTTYQNRIEKYIEDNQLEQRVKLVGYAKNEDLAAIYQSADLFVYPSFFEGIGLPIIESLMSKTPVITSKGSCFTEAGGPGALYIDPLDIRELANAMKSVLNDESTKMDLVKNGYDYVQKFREEVVTRSLLNIYQSLLNA